MRVLLIKMSSLGDVVHALPAVMDAASMGVRFDWVVEEAFADIPAAHPAVERVLPIAWRRWRKSLGASGQEMKQFMQQLRTQHYDLVLDAQGLIKSSAVALCARGPRLGFSHTSAREPWAAFAYGRKVRVPRALHAIDRQRRLFARAFGYEPPAQMTSGLEHRGGRDNTVLLLHGTTWDTKHYPVAMWRALATLIMNEGFTPVVTWGNEQERVRATAIAADGAARVLDRTPIAQLLGHLGRAALVIGVDSGLAHLSAALGTPTLGLFGPTDGELTGCRGIHAAVYQADTPCSPCLSKRCRDFSGEIPLWQGEQVQPPCFATLLPEQVWARGRSMIAAA